MRLTASDAAEGCFDDGVPHHVSLHLRSAVVMIKVNGGSEVHHRLLENSSGWSSSSSSLQLDSNCFLYLGGVAPAKQRDLAFVPVRLTVQRGYVGCVRHLTMNTDRVSLVALTRRQETSSEEVVPGCSRSQSSAQCPTYPCLHRGICSEGWNRFICDCRATGFHGPNCAHGRCPEELRC